MRKKIQIILRINPRKKKRSVKRGRRIPNHKVLRGRNIRRIVSIKKINNDELKVIKEEQSKKRIDDELEVIKKEIENELKVTGEKSSGKLNRNRN